MISSLNVTEHELVGLFARISSAACTNLIGLNGTVIDETKSMLSLGTSRGIKQVPKDRTTFELSPIEGSVVRVEGSRILGRPYARLRNRR